MFHFQSKPLAEGFLTAEFFISIWPCRDKALNYIELFEWVVFFAGYESGVDGE